MEQNPLSRHLTPEEQDTLRSKRGKIPVRQLSRETGIPRTTIQDFYNREDRPERTIEAPAVHIGRRILDSEVRPLAIDLPPATTATVVREGVITALVYSDTHSPNEDESTTAVIRGIARDLQPSLIGHLGDLLDCYSLSRFDKDPKRLYTLQDEINLARIHLARMREASPASRFILLEGNHEDRLRRTLWNAEQSASVLLHLDLVRDMATWPTLLGLDQLGIEWVPSQGQARASFLPKFILKHGTIVRKKSAYTAAGELEKYGRSGASGHTHRLGAHWHNDHNGAHVWIETGCTCITLPEYVEDPDWQAGCVVLSFDQETGAVGVEPVEIRNGRAVWRGNVYTAN